MIEFPEIKQDKREIFKHSSKSICHQCIYLDDKCEKKVLMWCKTDRKIQKAYVFKCDRYEKNN